MHRITYGMKFQKTEIPTTENLLKVIAKRFSCKIWVVIGVLCAVCFGEMASAKEESNEVKTATNDFISAREVYNEVLEKTQYNTSSLESQLAFNKKKEQELAERLKVKEEFLSNLPKRMGKYLSQMKRTSGGNSAILEESAGQFSANYDTLQQGTVEEIETLRKDLYEVRLRIAVLEPQIEMKKMKNDFRISSLGLTTSKDEKPQKYTVSYLEGIAGDAMKDEVKEMANLNIISVTEDDTYRANLLGKNSK